MTESSFKIDNLSLNQIFSDQFCYHLPIYQRPYSWKKDNVTQLLTDFLSASKSTSGQEYFLGSVVLVKVSKPESNSNDVNVIDGQQRLTTLFLLFVVAYARKIRNIRGYLEQREDSNLKRKSCLRFNVRHVDQSFFQGNIARLERNPQYDEGDEDVAPYRLMAPIQDLINKKRKDINNEQELKFKENIKVIDDFFQELQNNKELDQFVAYVLTYVKMIIITTNSEETAFRIFSTLNARGLELSQADIFKSDLIGRMAKDESELFGDQWDRLEQSMGRHSFEEMFRFINTYLCYSRAKGVIEPQELRDTFKNLLSQCPKGVTEATTYAKMLLQLGDVCELLYQKSLKRSIEGVDIQVLNSYKCTEWIPIGIFLKENFENHQLPNLFQALEKYWFVVQLIGQGNAEKRKLVNATLRKLFELKKENVDGSSVFSSKTIGTLRVPKTGAFSQEEAFKLLVNSSLFSNEFSLQVVQRCDFLMCDETRKETYGYSKKLTKERVLPENPESDSDWNKMDKRTAQANTNKLGNLVLVTKALNSKARNLCFSEKKKVFFENEKLACLPSTQMLNEYEKWDKDSILNRHARMLKTLHAYYTPDITFPAKHSSLLSSTPKKELKRKSSQDTDSTEPSKKKRRSSKN